MEENKVPLQKSWKRTSLVVLWVKTFAQSQLQFLWHQEWNRNLLCP